MSPGSAIVASTNEVQIRAGASGNVQPNSNASIVLAALSVLRRLSIIFQRPIRGSSSITVFALLAAGAKPSIHGSNCQSPRAQR